MAKPISTNNITTGKESCTPISSNCVIWKGPDIECIELCNGDTITDVTYKLATLVCELADCCNIDISTLSFTCLLEEGQEAPTNHLGLLQLLITRVCDIYENCCEEGSVSEDIICTLPTCLQYEEGGETITQLPIKEYAELLASKICEFQDDITDLYEIYNDLDTRITTLEQEKSSCACDDIIVITNCFSTNEGEEQSEKEISEAFIDLETNLCDYVSFIGEDTEITEAVETQCEGLSDAQQLNDLEHIMSELDGWVETPSKITDAIKNIWLTICDMRAKIIDCCNITELCVPMPVRNLAITDLSETGSTITWDAPSTSETENPVEYFIDVWEWDGIANVGASAVISDTTTDLFYDITAVPDINLHYAVYVRAKYETCEYSEEASVFGYVFEPLITRCITLAQGYTEIEDECFSETYNYKEYLLTATLRNYATQAIITNTSNSITVEIEVDVEDACLEAPYTPYTETLYVVIPKGFTTGSNTYISEKREECLGEEFCGAVTRTLSSVVDISEADTTVCPDSIIGL